MKKITLSSHPILARLSRAMSLALMAAMVAAAMLAPRAAAAQTTPPLDSPSDILALSDLSFGEPRLSGPLDSAFRTFGLPAEWELLDGAALQLNLSVAIPNAPIVTPVSPLSGTVAITLPAQTTTAVSRGSLRVVMNDVLVTEYTLSQSGEVTLRLPLKPAALKPATGGTHYIVVTLDDRVPCDPNRRDFTVVQVLGSSQLILPHRVIAPSTDLKLLPAPIVQRSVVPDVATLIVPDRPTPAELQAALTVAAGLGRLSAGSLGITLTAISQMTNELWNTTHLVLVGKPPSFPVLNLLSLPSKVSGTGFTGVNSDDGVLQMAQSPYNRSKVALVVSGGTDVAVVKAARALSFGVVRSGNPSNLAVVAGFAPSNQSQLVGASDFSFSQFGFQEARLTTGNAAANLEFDLPQASSASDEAYVDLTYVHSSLLNYQNSNANVTLNGQYVGSIRFDDTSTRLHVVRIPLPPTAMRPGQNLLSIQAELNPRDICGAQNLWMTIRPESRMHLPLNPSGSGPEAPRALSLGGYPVALVSQPDLSNLGFVLPVNDSGAWRTAAIMAFQIGQNSAVRPLDLAVAFANGVSPEIRRDRDLIVIGKPSDLPIMAELNPALPAPFEAGKNIAQEPNSEVQYRIDPGADVGYVQLAPAPWGANRTVMGVFGSTDLAMTWLNHVFSQPRLRGQLSGNLVVVNDRQLVASSTQRNAVGSSTASGTAETTAAPVAATGPVATAPATPSLILPIIAVATVLVVLAGIALSFVSRRKKADEPADESESEYVE